MSIHSFTEDSFEFFTIETHPSSSYSTRLLRTIGGAVVYSTNSEGIVEQTYNPTGSVSLYHNKSPIEKDVRKVQAFDYTAYEDSALDEIRKNIVKDTTTNKQSALNFYISKVFLSVASARKQKKKEIIRSIPSVVHSSLTQKKALITNKLMPYYRPNNITANFNFTNYNCVNFLSGAINTTSFPVPTSSVFLYPNPRQTLINTGIYTSQYGHTPSGSFSFDFWINPKYTVNDGDAYKAGCIMHLSGAYAISLHTGSYKDPDGHPKKFKLMLQLSTGTNIRPSSAVAGTSVFFSNDNVLNYNTWHHVTIRHGGFNYNNNSGSFFVDSINVGNFTFSEAAFGLYDAGNSLTPSVLCVGNYFNGANNLDKFFNANVATRDGLYQLDSGTADPAASTFDFSNPLQAEIHDLKLYDKYLTITDIQELQLAGPKSLSKLKFYLPPFFTEESPTRQKVGTYGGILQTPFYEKDGTTITPYNGPLAFSTNGFYMNLENYTRDFASGKYPRLWDLTGSVTAIPTTNTQAADYYLYNNGTNAGANKKRLYTILPCDHGGWNPNFDLLRGMSGSKAGGKYSNDFGNTDIGHVNLRNIVTGSFITLATLDSIDSTNVAKTIKDGTTLPAPEINKLTLAPLNIPAINDFSIYNRLRDGDSNQVVIFNVSNLYYGMKIKPKSLTLKDTNLSGSDGKLSITIRDDGYGNLYRADSYGVNATWASIGNIFYDEGLIIIKAPQLSYFGKEGFDISFSGIQNIHTTTYNCYAQPLTLLSSSNTSWSPDLKLDEDLANEPEQGFVYITGVNIHDDNMNIVMKARLAQPVPKKSSDKILIKLRTDW